MHRALKVSAAGAVLSLAGLTAVTVEAKPSYSGGEPLSAAPAAPMREARSLPARAAEAHPALDSPEWQRKITFRTVREDALDALKRLLKEAGVGYVIQGSPARRNPVTVDLKDVSLKNALDSLALAAGMSYRIRGNVVLLAPLTGSPATILPSPAPRAPRSPLVTPYAPRITPSPPPALRPYHGYDRDFWNGEEWRRRMEEGDGILIPRWEVEPDGTLIPRWDLPELRRAVPAPDAPPPAYTVPPGTGEPDRVITSPARPGGKSLPPLSADIPRETLRLREITVGELFRLLEILPERRSGPRDLLQWGRSSPRSGAGIPGGILRLEGVAGGRALKVYGDRAAIRTFRDRIRWLDVKEGERNPSPLTHSRETWRLGQLTAGEILTRLRLPQENVEAGGGEVRWWALRGMNRPNPDPGIVRVSARRESRELDAEGRSDLLEGYLAELRRHDGIEREGRTKVVSRSPRPPARHETWRLDRLMVGELLEGLRLPSEWRERRGDRVRWHQVLGMDRFERDPGLVTAQGEVEGRTLLVQGRPDILAEFRRIVERRDGDPRSLSDGRERRTLRLNRLKVRDLFGKFGIPVPEGSDTKALSWDSESSVRPRLFRYMGRLSVRGEAEGRSLEVEGDPNTVKQLAGIVERFERIEELRTRR